MLPELPFAKSTLFSVTHEKDKQKKGTGVHTWTWAWKRRQRMNGEDLKGQGHGFSHSWDESILIRRWDLGLLVKMLLFLCWIPGLLPRRLPGGNPITPVSLSQEAPRLRQKAHKPNRAKVMFSWTCALCTQTFNVTTQHHQAVYFSCKFGWESRVKIHKLLNLVEWKESLKSRLSTRVSVK